MKYLKGISENCVGCHVCEEVCSQMFFKVNDVERSAIKITEQDGKNVITVCNQCGACTTLCPVQAISKNAQGVVTINKKNCVGCLICVAECPCGAMFYHVDEPIPFKCIACSGCVSKCPAEALKIEKE